MSDNLPQKTNYANNSDKAKGDPQAQTDREPMKQLTQNAGVVRKRSIGSKFREAFTGDDARSVGNYLFFDVAVPAGKKLIFDMISEGTSRVLFGSTRVSSRQGGILGSRGTNYNRVYSGGVSNTQSPAREISQHARNTHNFDREIILETRAEADEVIDALVAYIDEYKSVTVADLYAAIGETASHTDTKYGWYSLSTAGVRNVREGYLLELPPTRPLD